MIRASDHSSGWKEIVCSMAHDTSNSQMQIIFHPVLSKHEPFDTWGCKLRYQHDHSTFLGLAACSTNICSLFVKPAWGWGWSQVSSKGVNHIKSQTLMLSAILNNSYVGGSAGFLSTVMMAKYACELFCSLSWVSQILSYQLHLIFIPVFPASAKYLLKHSEGISYDTMPHSKMAILEQWQFCRFSLFKYQIQC